MAKILSNVNILTGQVVEAHHVTQSIDAFTGVEAYDITLSGSLTIIGPNNITVQVVASGFTGSLHGTASWALNTPNTVSASYAATASYVVSSSYSLNTTSASYASNSTSASYALNTTSASYATTSSYSNNLQRFQ